MSTFKQVIVMRTDLGMNAGKVGSQAAHAAMLILLNRMIRGQGFSKTISDWVSERSGENHPGWHWGDMTKIVVAVDSLEELNRIELEAKALLCPVHAVYDNTLQAKTCIAIGPDFIQIIDDVTGKLPLFR